MFSRVKVGGNPQCDTRTAEEMHSATHNKPPGVGGWDNEISQVTTAEPRVCPPHKWIRNLISNKQRLGKIQFERINQLCDSNFHA